MEDTCQICGDGGPDLRSVNVDCFYEIHEVASHATRNQVFTEVDEDGDYLAATRRYEKGIRNTIRIVKTGEHSSKTVDDPKPIGKIRLAEKSVYTIRCCKDCRGDFLDMFGRWAAGAFKKSEGLGNIPVRINGTTRMVTKEQYDQMQKG